MQRGILIDRSRKGETGVNQVRECLIVNSKTLTPKAGRRAQASPINIRPELRRPCRLSASLHMGFEIPRLGRISGQRLSSLCRQLRRGDRTAIRSVAVDQAGMATETHQCSMDTKEKRAATT